MKKFNNQECNAQYVLKIKKLYKQQSNNRNIMQRYNAILNDTKIAIENLDECINSSEMLNNMFNSIKQENISFMKELLGVTGQGNNESLYRGYLALNGKNILELRVSNHYETKSVAKEKSNNISQYLFQVVLITNPPKAIATDAVIQSGKLANLQIITKEITETSSEDDFIKLLKSIHDFLISPGSEYEESISKQEDATNKENNKDNIDDSKKRKNTFRLTESQLHRMIKESVREVLKESYNNSETIKKVIDLRKHLVPFTEYLEENYNFANEGRDFVDKIYHAANELDDELSAFLYDNQQQEIYGY